MKNNIKKYILLLTICILWIQCKAQDVNIENKHFLDMPFEQVDFNNEKVYYEIACQEQDLNNDGLKDIILFLDFPDDSYENPNLDEKIKNSTLICLQEPTGNYRSYAFAIRFLNDFVSSKINCTQGGFVIITEGDRYDNHTYTMEFTYKDDGFYMTRKIVESEFQDQPLEDIQINDKSVPLDGFNLPTFFKKYMDERDARQKKMYPDG